MNQSYRSHVVAEGLDTDHIGTNRAYDMLKDIPEDVLRAIGEAGYVPSEAPFLNFMNREVSLYRGEDESTLDDLLEEDGSLAREEFPVFFTTSREAAENRYAQNRADESVNLLIEVKVPFDSVEYLISGKLEFTEDYDISELEEETMYFSHEFDGASELGAVSVPEEWIESIEPVKGK